MDFSVQVWLGQVLELIQILWFSISSFLVVFWFDSRSVRWLKQGQGSHIEPKTFSKILNFPRLISLLDIPKMQHGQIVQNKDEMELRRTSYVAMDHTHVPIKPRKSYIKWKLTFRFHSFITGYYVIGAWLSETDRANPKGSSYSSDFIFEFNVGKSRIRYTTTLKLNDEFLDWLKPIQT